METVVATLDLNLPLAETTFARLCGRIEPSFIDRRRRRHRLLPPHYAANSPLPYSVTSDGYPLTPAAAAAFARKARATTYISVRAEGGKWGRLGHDGSET
ncbi:hypothetical protein GWI33_014266 [Rhynchophorus ferrugineus]|uniref:Uncharacterized protein n=1 Tax=Rhynchophorus ferrugineus TaxID=354439 RepID=A0A834I1T0_RHYFE|nr:hypothetical protein GWI33_014266 [Rhynchophorus ferrugineus]